MNGCCYSLQKNEVLKFFFSIFYLITENVPLAMGNPARRSVANNPSTPYDTYIVQPKSKVGATTTSSGETTTTTAKIPVQTSTAGNFYPEAGINATAR